MGLNKIILSFKINIVKPTLSNFYFKQKSKESFIQNQAQKSDSTSDFPDFLIAF